MLTVTIRAKDGGERTLHFEQEEVTLGRSDGCEIVLAKNNISKRHARFVDKGDKVILVDLRSTNGTYVNGEKLGADPRRLRNFDRIELGGTDTTVHWIFMESQSTIDVPLPSSQVPPDSG